MNRVIEIGRAVKDIELKRTTSGTSVVSFSIAVKRNFKNAEGNYDSDFFDCIAFNKLAETISTYIHKGDLFGVVGRLQARSYTDKEGNNRKVTEIVVEEIEFLTPKKEEPAKTYSTFNTEDLKMEEFDPFEELPF